MRVRRKPTETDAVQFDGNLANDPPGVIRRPEDLSPYVLTIHNQRVYVSPGDWILPEPDGVHHYPVKPDVFNTTYEPVADGETSDDKMRLEVLCEEVEDAVLALNFGNEAPSNIASDLMVAIRRAMRVVR